MNDVIRRMSALFDPQSIAFVGATNRSDKWGFRILSGLLHYGYRGKVYPINPSEHEDILGIKPFPSVSSIPESPDLAVVVTPQPTVLGIVGECVQKGVKACLVITAGFAELGRKEEERLENEIVDTARKGGMVLVGPNSNGIMSMPSNLYLLMSRRLERTKHGSLSITSRSGSVGTSVLALCVDRNFGFNR
ncbi:MAG TPA: CoA-binding protein, partial [Syntrophales bacterium]|nr:CoA-binding protein [Syntrophales bacterium]